MVWSLVVAVVCSLPLLFYILSKWRYGYWERKGVVQLNPELFYGDLRSMLTSKATMGETFKDLYFTFKGMNLNYGGIYWVLKPAFIPTDIKIIKDILQTKFSHFQDRGLYNHKNDLLTNHLFRMEGDAWKQLRVKLTPTFTSARMKMMFETLLEKNENLGEVADHCVRSGGRIEVKDVAARYTTDVIGSCAFGIECDSLKDGDCDFRVYGKKVNTPRIFKQWIENLFPRTLLGYTGYRSFPELEDFFRKLVKDTIDHREKHNIYRKDFMHLLIQLRNRGILTDDGKITKDATEKGILTDDEIIAQSFLFFSAGFDTSSATITFVLYELAKHPDIQDKVRQEIWKVMQKYDGKLTYEGAKELELTEKVISDFKVKIIKQKTLRQYPVAPTVPRVCTKSYNVPGSDIVLEKGTMVQISMWGIHMDPEYYPNPEVWDPERFSPEEKAKRPEFTYFPFSEGPRVCIGARFGMMQIKVGLVGLLKDYHFTACPETPNPITFAKGQFLLHAKEDIWLNISKVKK